MVGTIRKYKVLVIFCILFCDMKNIITLSPRMKCCVYVWFNNVQNSSKYMYKYDYII